MNISDFKELAARMTLAAKNFEEDLKFVGDYFNRMIHEKNPSIPKEKVFKLGNEFEILLVDSDSILFVCGDFNIYEGNLLYNTGEGSYKYVCYFYDPGNLKDKSFLRDELPHLWVSILRKKIEEGFEFIWEI
jgi:hypothetical protein